jgi:LysR family carnitine catabolism transcriptional activator
MRKLNNFSGRLLAAFVTLVDCGQFKLAASRFHVSQSAFSQMISRLEADVGARLFNRDTRHVSLTPEGQTLLPIARAIAADVDAMYALMRDLVERRQGKVALAALPSLSSDWLPAIIAEYRRRYPGITVQFFDTVPEQNVELVRRGAVDFALNARVGNPDEFETAPLFDEPFFLVCAATHPLAGRKRVALAALTGCDYIHTSRTGSIFHWLAPFLRDLRIHDTGLEVGHLSTLAGLVAQGCGVSLVPASGAAPVPAPGPGSGAGQRPHAQATAAGGAPARPRVVDCSAGTAGLDQGDTAAPSDASAGGAARADRFRLNRAGFRPGLRAPPRPHCGSIFASLAMRDHFGISLAMKPLS